MICRVMLVNMLMTIKRWRLIILVMIVMTDESVIGKTRLRHLRARPALADSFSHRRVWPRQVNCDASFHLFIIILNIFLPRLVIFTVNQDIGLSAGNQLCGNLTGQHGRVIIVWSGVTLELSNYWVNATVEPVRWECSFHWYDQSTDSEDTDSKRDSGVASLWTETTFSPSLWWQQSFSLSWRGPDQHQGPDPTLCLRGKWGDDDDGGGDYDDDDDDDIQGSPVYKWNIRITLIDCTRNEQIQGRETELFSKDYK